MSPAPPPSPSDLRLGVDLGGTKVEVLGLASDGAEVYRRRIPSPRGDYQATLEAVATLVEEAERELGVRGTVGLGIPGTLSEGTGKVKNANSTWLNGQPLRGDLEHRLHRPVRMMNDANCFALSEALDGAAAGARVVFGIILGTGVGGGIVVDGRLLPGLHGIAGEWGHNPLPWPRDNERPGPECYCGRRGCLETFLSGPGLARDHTERTGARGVGGAWTARAVAEAAADGAVAARRSLEAHQERLARGLASVVNLLDPDVVVVGGGLSNLPGLLPGLPELMAPWLFNDEIRTRVVRNRHGDSSGVRGAAWLWP